MIIDKVKAYLKTCPLLVAKAKKGTINVNYLGEEPCEYSIEVISVNPLVKRYTDGGELRQYLFAVCSREAYDANALENMNVAKFFEEFEDWISEQDKAGIYPELSNGMQAIKIEVVSSGYLDSSDEDRARFSIEIKLTYRKER